MIRGADPLILPLAGRGGPNQHRPFGHNGRVRACITQEGAFISCTSDCKDHLDDCDLLCNTDHRTARNVILHRQFECQNPDCHRTQRMTAVVGDRDYQAAGAMLGVGLNYELTLGWRYTWNQSPHHLANPYLPPVWPVNLR
jgi:hypothetical protein